MIPVFSSPVEEYREHTTDLKMNLAQLVSSVLYPALNDIPGQVPEYSQAVLCWLSSNSDLIIRPTVHCTLQCKFVMMVCTQTLIIDLVLSCTGERQDCTRDSPLRLERKGLVWNVCRITYSVISDVCDKIERDRRNSIRFYGKTPWEKKQKMTCLFPYDHHHWL